MSLRQSAVLFVVLFTVFSSLATAQFRWGAHAGVNIANLDIESDAVITTNNIVGYVAGIRGEYQLTRALSVYLSPQYVLKGSDVELERIDEAESHYDVTIREKYHYLEVPLGLRLRLPARGIKPYIFAGAGVAALLSSTFSVQERVYGPPEEEYEEDGTKYRTDLDVIMQAGIGAEMSLSQTTALTFDIRYGRSLQTIDEPIDLAQDRYLIYTSDIMLVFGVLFM